jgi:AraC-like DNA-binding protein
MSTTVQQESDLDDRTDQAPILAGRAGTYHEAHAIGPLRDHFQCVWTNAIHRDHIGPIAVVPDGCVDLVWWGDGIVVAGPDISSAHSVPTPGTTLLGLRFQPGAAVGWLGLPLSEIVGQQIDLGDVWGQRARDLSAMIEDAATAAERLRLWQSQLLQLVPNRGAPDREMRAVFDAMTGGGAGPRKLRSIQDRLDISERTLRRRCHDHFGYGPKTLDRILRFQSFVRIVRTSGGSSLSGLAFAAGYADQAHLSRDIRELCGMTASALVRQLAP